MSVSETFTVPSTGTYRSTDNRDSVFYTAGSVIPLTEAVRLGLTGARLPYAPPLSDARMTAGAPSDIGAKGDGFVDDFAPILARIARAKTIRDLVGGAIVDIPAGVYRLTDEISTAGLDRIHIRGAGKRKTILRPEKRKCAFRGANTLAGVLTDFTLSDLEIDGSNQSLDGDTYSASVFKGVYVSYMRRCKFLDLYIHDCAASGLGVDFLGEGCVIERVWAIGNGRLNDGTNGGGSGIGIGTGSLDANGEYLLIDACYTANNKRYGIFTEVQGDSVVPGITVSNSFAVGNTIGFGDAGGRGGIWKGCHAYLNTKAGFAVNQGTLAHQPGLETIFDACVAWGNGTVGDVLAAGFLIETTTTDASLNGLRMANCRSRSNVGHGVLFNVARGSVAFRRIALDGCDVHANRLCGVKFVYNGTGTDLVLFDVAFNNCRIYDNYTTSTGNDKNGIRITTNITRLDVQNTHIWDDLGTPKQDTAITLVAGVTLVDPRFVNVRSHGHVTKEFDFLGTLTTPFFDNCPGFPTQASGTATVANGTTSVVVTHGLALTPALKDIVVTPTNNLGNAAKYWISTPTATQFTINVNADPAAGTATFAWKAEIR